MASGKAHAKASWIMSIPAGLATGIGLSSIPSDTMTIEQVLEMLHTPDYACLGHFHTPMLWMLMGIEILANGAMCGSSVYSAKRLHTATPPSQRMFFVYPDHGVGFRLPINLSEVS